MFARMQNMTSVFNSDVIAKERSVENRSELSTNSHLFPESLLPTLNWNFADCL